MAAAFIMPKSTSVELLFLAAQLHGVYAALGRGTNVLQYGQILLRAARSRVVIIVAEHIVGRDDAGEHLVTG